MLRRVEWFTGVPDEVLGELAAGCTVSVLGRDDVVYRSGQRPSCFFVLLAGRVGAWRVAPDERLDVDDRESMLYFVADEPGTTLCLENVVADIPYFATMRALDARTRVLSVQRTVLDAALQADLTLGIRIAEHIARRLQAFTEQMTDFGVLTVGRRLAKYLVTRVEPATNIVTVGLSQAELASRLGASRQSISTTLATFVQRGWLRPLERGSYQVVDLPALQSLARFPRWSGTGRVERLA